MKPSVALSVGVLAILGLVFRVAPSGSEGTSKSAPSSKPAEATKKQDDENVKKPIKLGHLGPWLATCQYFGRKLDQNRIDGASI